MHAKDTNESISQPRGHKRRWVVLVGSTAMLAILAIVGLWFMQRDGGTEAGLACRCIKSHRFQASSDCPCR